MTSTSERINSRPRNLAAILVLYAAAALWLFSEFAVDDAYISFVYSKNLAAGNGLTYNGLVVEGFSNFLWTVLFSLLLQLDLDPITLARAASLASGGLALGALYRLQFRLTPGIQHPDAFLATLIVGLSAPFLAWTMGGLETVFFAALITIAVYLESLGTPISRWGAVLLTVAAALTRPEGVLVFGVLFIYRLVKSQRFDRELAAAVALFAVLYGAFLAWRWVTFGYLLPNTAYIKLDTGTRVFFPAAGWLLDFLVLQPIFSILFLGGLAVVIVERAFVRNPVWFLVGGLAAAFAGFVLFAGRDWMPHHRFLVPVLPFAGLFIGRLLARWGPGRTQFFFRTFTLAGVLFGIGASLTLYRGVTVEFGRYLAGQIDAGRRIRTLTDPGDIIAVIDAGAIPYYSERPTINLVGLNNETIAHQGLDPDFVFSQAPAVIQLHIAFDRTGMLTEEPGNETTARIVDHPDLARCYTPDPDRPDDPFYPYLFFRHCP